MGLLKYTIYRLLQAIPVMFGIAVVTFLLVNLSPGDPVDYMISEQLASEELIASIEQRYGLDEPLWKQFLNYIGFSWFLGLVGIPGFADAPPGLLQGDLGLSMYYDRPVAELMLTRIPRRSCSCCRRTPSRWCLLSRSASSPQNVATNRPTTSRASSRSLA